MSNDIIPHRKRAPASHSLIPSPSDLAASSQASAFSAFNVAHTLGQAALSHDTLLTARRISDLRIQPSPASLSLFTLESQRKKPLEERLFDALANVKILTANVAMHLDREWRDKLFRQIDSLHDPAEWDQDDEPIKQHSFSTFLKGILQISPKRRPGLGLTYTGHLIAAWVTGRDRLTIEFLPKDHVRWVLTQYYEDEPERYAGQTPVSRLAEGLKPYHPEHWFSNED